MLDPATISPGMWNKLYALLAIKRKAIGNNICIYSGTQYEYDVTNRTYWARITEEEIAKLKQAL
jgi:hypothetical protein